MQSGLILSQQDIKKIIAEHFHVSVQKNSKKNDYNNRSIKHHDKRKQNKLRANIYNPRNIGRLGRNVRCLPAENRNKRERHTAHRKAARQAVCDEINALQTELETLEGAE